MSFNLTRYKTYRCKTKVLFRFGKENEKYELSKILLRIYLYAIMFMHQCLRSLKFNAIASVKNALLPKFIAKKFHNDVQ